MPLDNSWEPKGEHVVITEAGPIPIYIRRIDSSNIEWIGWPKDGGQRLMFVEFKDGSRYVYNGVSRQRAVSCAYSDSTGSYFQKNIRGKYETLKLR